MKADRWKTIYFTRYTRSNMVTGRQHEENREQKSFCRVFGGEGGIKISRDAKEEENDFGGRYGGATDKRQIRPPPTLNVFLCRLCCRRYRSVCAADEPRARATVGGPALVGWAGPRPVRRRPPGGTATRQFDRHRTRARRRRRQRRPYPRGARTQEASARATLPPSVPFAQQHQDL